MGVKTNNNFDLNLSSQEFQGEMAGPFFSGKGPSKLKEIDTRWKPTTGLKSNLVSIENPQLGGLTDQNPLGEHGEDPAVMAESSKAGLESYSTESSVAAAESKEKMVSRKKKSKEKDRIAQCGNQSFEEHRWEYYQAESLVRQEVEYTWKLGNVIGLEAETPVEEIEQSLGELVKQDKKGGRVKSQAKKRRVKKVI